MADLLLRKSSYALHYKSRKQRGDGLEAMILAVVERQMSFDELIDWFRQRIIRVR